MSEKELKTCYEKLEKCVNFLKTALIVNSVLLLVLIGTMSAGFFISYKEVYKDVYHTSFVNQDIIKQLYGVDIQYNKSIRKIEVKLVNPEKALINEIIKRK